MAKTRARTCKTPANPTTTPRSPSFESRDPVECLGTIKAASLQLQSSLMDIGW
ncbi:hypothetical protein AZE42_10950 [Rhizopogon vesiculosus]|uniref:Uncharacterized protein n=1 Tax=Rhizopogon vesiculosus TaxID=180088 RepID=A0A1J8QB92_9AGAM|nr:hypothetical protein AZE42_10950 [Rhizopogon vesiculosus]